MSAARAEPEVDAVSQIEFTEPVELEFWHTKTRSQEELLNEIVAEFNATNEYGITVVPTSIEGSYDQIFKDTCKDTRNLSKGRNVLGCPLCSAVACILARILNKPITIEKEEQCQDGRLTTTQYRILEE